MQAGQVLSTESPAIIQVQPGPGRLTIDHVKEDQEKQRQEKNRVFQPAVTLVLQQSKKLQEVLSDLSERRGPKLGNNLQS